MTQHLISKSDFATLCNISRGAVTKLVKGRLARAIVGSRIDLSNQLAQDYVEEKTGVRPELGADPVEKPTTAPGGPPGQMEPVPEDLTELYTLTLLEISAKYGTAPAFYDWLRAVNQIETVTEKRIRNAEREGRLVGRDMVKTAILDRIDGTFVKLLTDGATTISSRAVAIVKAGGDAREVKAMVEDQLGSFIRPAKDQMHRALDGTD